MPELLPPDEVPPAPSDDSPQRPLRRSWRRHPYRLALLMLAVTLLVAAVPVGASIRQALVAPGQASTSVRLIEWVRDHGGSGVVNLAENLWYAHNEPAAGAPDPTAIPKPSAPAPPPAPAVFGPPALPMPQHSELPSEARWEPSVQRIGGRAPVETAFFRPLPASSVVVGIAWMDQSLVRTRLVAGTQDPAPSRHQTSVDGLDAQVPPADRATLLATFNAGFKLHDARGGYETGGREIVPLRPGAASLVIDASGRVDVGAWGRDIGPAPNVAAVRQNLDLIVDRSAPVPGLTTNSGGEWGGDQSQYTWRSGLGIDAHGNLIYLAADKITLADLASSLSAAGAVRGMQLDIHPAMVTYMTYGPGQARTSGTGTRLLPAMQPPTDRYLVPSQRDFLAVTTR